MFGQLLVCREEKEEDYCGEPVARRTEGSGGGKVQENPGSTRRKQGEERDPERDHETMPGNCQWELLAGSGNPRIMPVGGYMVKAKQKSKLSTLLFAELWDSP